jgi:hypothetical protein
LLCNFSHSPVTSSLLGPNILLSTLLSNTFSLCFSLYVRDQISHTDRTACSNFFMFFYSRREDRRFWTEW